MHLFRALLRQCTYLPDPTTRVYMKNHIISRFRDYHPENTRRRTSRASRGTKPLALIQQRLPALLKTARKGILYLQRANDGHFSHLSKILSMTYGRLGKRRHQLLTSLKVPDIPMNETALRKLSEPGSQGIPHPSQQLLALINAQSRTKCPTSVLMKPKVAPAIPELNAWARPMPVKRVRNIKRRWYAETLSKIMPPLPPPEWHRLHALSLGEIPWDGPVPRRGTLSVKGYERGIVRGITGFSKPHELTPRYIRRLWEKVLVQCPMMQLDGKAWGGWDVRWGDAGAQREVVLVTEGRGASDMFEGVDEAGRVLHPLPQNLPVERNGNKHSEPMTV